MVVTEGMDYDTLEQHDTVFVFALQPRLLILNARKIPRCF